MVAGDYTLANSISTTTYLVAMLAESSTMGRPAAYHRIAKDIHRAVKLYGDRQDVPSSRVLARRYGVSRHTIRRALGLLVERGVLADRGPGRSYVRCRSASEPKTHRLYPAVALYLLRSVQLTAGDYMGSVLASFLSVASARLRVCVERLTPHTSLSPIPGGVLLGSPESRVGAVVFASGVSDGLLTDLVAGDAIVMTLDSVSNVDGVDCVAVDCQWEAETAVEYLAGQGHRTIAFLAVGWMTDRERWADGLDPDGWRFEQAMLAAKQRLGLNHSRDYHIEYIADVAGTDTPERAVVDRLLRLKPRPTAAICFSSTTAQKVVDALRQRGLRCPRDLSVLTRSSSGSHFAAITRFQSDPVQIGRSAAEHLLNRFAYNSAGPTRLLIRSRLVEGSTVAPVES